MIYSYDWITASQGFKRVSVTFDIGGGRAGDVAVVYTYLLTVWKLNQFYRGPRPRRHYRTPLGLIEDPL